MPKKKGVAEQIYRLPAWLCATKPTPAQIRERRLWGIEGFETANVSFFATRRVPLLFAVVRAAARVKGYILFLEWQDLGRPGYPRELVETVDKRLGVPVGKASVPPAREGSE